MSIKYSEGEKLLVEIISSDIHRIVVTNHGRCWSIEDLGTVMSKRPLYFAEIQYRRKSSHAMSAVEGDVIKQYANSIAYSGKFGFARDYAAHEERLKKIINVIKLLDEAPAAATQLAAANQRVAAAEQQLAAANQRVAAAEQRAVAAEQQLADAMRMLSAIGAVIDEAHRSKMNLDIPY